MLIDLIIYLVVLGLLFWVLGLLPLAEPYGQIIRVVGIVIAVLVLINYLRAYLPASTLF